MEGFHTDRMGSRSDRSISSGVTFTEECESMVQYEDRNLSNGLVQETMTKKELSDSRMLKLRETFH